MKHSKEIQSAINSIRYYSERIHQLTKTQFEEDASLDSINTQVGTKRFNSLGAINSGAEWVNTYCDNMEVNLKIAEAQDKLLTRGD